jgi:hypothetical protein
MPPAAWHDSSKTSCPCGCHSLGSQARTKLPLRMLLMLPLLPPRQDMIPQWSFICMYHGEVFPAEAYEALMEQVRR